MSSGFNRSLKIPSPLRARWYCSWCSKAIKKASIVTFSDFYNVFLYNKIDAVTLTLMPHTCADFAGPNLGPQISVLFASPSKVAMLLCNTKRPLPCSCNAWQPCQAFMQQAPVHYPRNRLHQPGKRFLKQR